MSCPSTSEANSTYLQLIHIPASLGRGKLRLPLYFVQSPVQCLATFLQGFLEQAFAVDVQAVKGKDADLIGGAQQKGLDNLCLGIIDPGWRKNGPGR